jgi:hypothetical protein
MSIEEIFGNHFKPEVRSSGKKLVSQEKISISSHSDTEIHAYARVAPPAKVKLHSDEVGSTAFEATCSCPTAKKSRFCKHIWGTILLVKNQYPDFLAGKNEISQNDEIVSPKNNYQEQAKQRASEYRKEQYQKQKSRVKEQKRARRGIESAPVQSYPDEIETALRYFAENGFPMAEGPSKEVVTEAKRKLSRFFHPDRGGSHEESVELNQHCEVLLSFLS